ncbi:hypothetical protein [Paenibacillus sp. sgz5001063]|uniref:hypothetical protein n=1 Tax=Paenibacillus sp. sgz5001063 TaxID=3242474 RepID=UPI0036D341D5
MKEIGGFFELEMGSHKKRYHLDAVALNSGRNALKYILMQKKFNKIFIPYYICESIIEPIKELGIEYEYYSINDKFEPILLKDIEDTDCILYVNYFGVNDRQVEKVTSNIKNIIIDNTQAFFSKPIQGVDTFYSPRKFFGVADGGFAYTNSTIKMDLEQDVSYDKYEYLLKRVDINAQESYSQYVKNEEDMTNQQLKKMSRVTEAFLQNINYESSIIKRIDNFKHLHSFLGNINKMHIDLTHIHGPMIYPLLIHSADLRSYLINNKIYVATYWKEVMNIVETNTVEYDFAKYLIPLPIDQRYDISDMNIIIELIRNFK